MSRSFYLLLLFVASCSSWCHHDPTPHACPAFVPPDGNAPVEIGDAGPTIDASFDAMPRPDEPINGRCVAPRGDDTDACKDSYEPNGDMIRASTSGAHECATTEKQAVLGTNDVDVFRTGDCSVGSLPVEAVGPLTPWAEIQPQDSTGDVSSLRLCVFPTCSNGSTNVYACYENAIGEAISDGSPSVTNDLFNSQVGFRGCCRTGPGRITVKAECPRHSNKIDTYIWIDSEVSAGACRPYTVRYSSE